MCNVAMKVNKFSMFQRFLRYVFGPKQNPKEMMEKRTSTPKKQLQTISILVAVSLIEGWLFAILYE